MSKVLIIGSGFSGLSAAATMAQQGADVTVLEKNSTFGGRARTFTSDGFRFDMGPSWYWMPEVFEEFFQRFSSSASDHYELRRLDPSYKVVFPGQESWDIPATMPELEAFFDSIESGAGKQLRSFLEEAQLKYELGMNDLVRKPALSWGEYIRWDVVSGMLRTNVFKSLRKHVADHFKNDRLRMLLEFPVLFLGASPQNTPSLYSLMNYADMSLGTWYPMGGMGKIIDGFVSVAKAQGAKLQANVIVEEIVVQNGKVSGVKTSNGFIEADQVIASADYNHVDQQLLPKEYRQYSESYWNNREMAPSSLLFYLGVEGELKNIDHHNLFFDESLDDHSHAIYEKPRWPEKPLFYANCTSKTDPTVSPQGHEALFLLVPLAAGLTDTEALREEYYEIIMKRLEKYCGHDVRSKVVFKRSYCVRDFKNDYNAFKGNAYGLANTIKQTAVLRPRIKSKKVSGLYYTGQLTVPGPGVPPAIISGHVAAQLALKELKPILA